MKSLILVRSSLLTNKKRFGIFRTKKKVLGKITFDSKLFDATEDQVKFLCTSFSRHQLTLKKLIEHLKFKRSSIDIDVNLQDQDVIGITEIIKEINDQFDIIVLFVPVAARKGFVKYFADKISDVPVGGFVSFDLGISSWKELKISIEEAVIRV